ncbi:MAG: ElyC/SanA/YdcF family protein [Pseudomonadota bacterium]
MSSNVRTIAILFAIPALMLIGGFAHFSQHTKANMETIPGRTDGIVVLTGGDRRIQAAAALLAEERARRLLISGVNQSVNPETLGNAFPEIVGFVDCCIDLDYEALNTVGNAREATQWMAAHGFRSIIVVTSSYHMPRSLLEFRRANPGVEIVPYAVEPPMAEGVWWRHPRDTRRVLSEYGKYVVALVRYRLERVAPGANVAYLTEQ